MGVYSFPKSIYLKFIYSQNLIFPTSGQCFSHLLENPSLSLTNPYLTPTPTNIEECTPMQDSVCTRQVSVKLSLFFGDSPTVASNRGTETVNSTQNWDSDCDCNRDCDRYQFLYRQTMAVIDDVEFYINGFVLLATSIFGIIGNFISILILQRKRSNLKFNPTFSQLITWSALIDTISLVKKIYQFEK